MNARAPKSTWICKTYKQFYIIIYFLHFTIRSESAINFYGNARIQAQFHFSSKASILDVQTNEWNTDDIKRKSYHARRRKAKQSVWANWHCLVSKWLDQQRNCVRSGGQVAFNRRYHPDNYGTIKVRLTIQSLLIIKQIISLF